jgi:hypothetical protein
MVVACFRFTACPPAGQINIIIAASAQAAEGEENPE